MSRGPYMKRPTRTWGPSSAAITSLARWFAVTFWKNRAGSAGAGFFPTLSLGQAGDVSLLHHAFLADLLSRVPWDPQETGPRTPTLSPGTDELALLLTVLHSSSRSPDCPPSRVLAHIPQPFTGVGGWARVEGAREKAMA